MKKIVLANLMVLLSVLAHSQNWFPSTGNVGIGTTTPAKPLDVSGIIQSGGGFYLSGGSGSFYQASSSFTRITGGYSEFIELGGDYGNAIRLGAHTIYFNGATTHENGLVTSTVSPYQFYGAGPNAAGVTIKSNWVNNGAGGYNVGSILNIGDDNINTGAGINNELNGILLSPVLNTTGGTTIIRGMYYNPVLTSTIGVTNIGIETVTGNTLLGTTSGNTIIGTATDDGTNKLQVNGSIKSTGLVIPTNAAAGKVLTSDANGNATWQNASGGSGGGSWALSGTTISNSNAGLVVIGTLPTVLPTDPSLKLAVNGNIYGRKLTITQSGWADYVFDPAYRLRSLKEIEAFVHKYQHLPDVPSAADVAANGIDVGDSQALLLKKVEELTLYIIDMNKKMDAQSQKIRAQDRKISRLYSKLGQKKR